MLFGSTTKIPLTVEGMTCQHCVQRVQDALEHVDGVKDAKVDLSDGTATVKAKDGVDAKALVHAVEEAGYQADEA